jgi:hypothetical protein
MNAMGIQYDNGSACLAICKCRIAGDRFANTSVTTYRGYLVLKYIAQSISDLTCRALTDTRCYTTISGNTAQFAWLVSLLLGHLVPVPSTS